MTTGCSSMRMATPWGGTRCTSTNEETALVAKMVSKWGAWKHHVFPGGRPLSWMVPPCDGTIITKGNYRECLQHWIFPGGKQNNVDVLGNKRSLKIKVVYGASSCKTGVRSESVLNKISEHFRYKWVTVLFAVCFLCFARPTAIYKQEGRYSYPGLTRTGSKPTEKKVQP